MHIITSRIVKYVTFALNIVIACAAVVLIAFGIAYVVKEQDAVKIFGDSLSFGALSISVGGIALAACLLGCFALFFENRILLTIYSSTLFLLFVAQLSLGIMAITKINNNFLDEVRKLVQEAFDAGGYVDFQRKFECCGVDGPRDYDDYPVSCCENETSPCLEPFDVGCADAFKDVVGQYVETIGAVGITGAVLEVFGAAFAFVARKRSTQFV